MIGRVLPDVASAWDLPWFFGSVGTVGNFFEYDKGRVHCCMYGSTRGSMAPKNTCRTFRSEFGANCDSL
jgi:hypothetical protein